MSIPSSQYIGNCVDKILLRMAKARKSSRCLLLHFMATKKPRGVIVQREEGISMVLPLRYGAADHTVRN